jgi:hypothetical protein
MSPAGSPGYPTPLRFGIKADARYAFLPDGYLLLHSFLSFAFFGLVLVLVVGFLGINRIYKAVIIKYGGNNLIVQQISFCWRLVY